MSTFRSHSLKRNTSPTNLELQVDKWQDYCSRVRFLPLAAAFFPSYRSGLAGMTGPSQVFLLSSREPTNHCCSARKNLPVSQRPKETKPKWHRSNWPGASDRTVQPERTVSSVIPSQSQIFILTHHDVEVLAEEARKVVTTLI